MCCFLLNRSKSKTRQMNWDLRIYRNLIWPYLIYQYDYLMLGIYLELSFGYIWDFNSNKTLV
jgi:hypothetical protein